MAFSNTEIKTTDFVKLVGVIIDRNLTWKNHIVVIENKISKIIGVLYRASPLLDFKSLLKNYFFFIHISVSYANIAWASTFKVGLSPSKKICFICFNESPLKMVKNTFYFILRALLVLKILKFLS